MKYYFEKLIIILILFFYPNIPLLSKDIKPYLQDLDRVIKKHSIYNNQRISHIDFLKNKLSSCISYQDSFNLQCQIIDEYKAFQCDSTIKYLNKNIQLSIRHNDIYMKEKSEMQLSYLFSSTGMYLESIDVLNAVNRKSIPENLKELYYSCWEHVYDEANHYTQDVTMKSIYVNNARKYKDSLYLILNRRSDQYMILKESEQRDAGNINEALRINTYRLKKTSVGTPLYALVTFQRSLIYSRKNDLESEMKWLSISALTDIKCANKDHASLWTLANRLYKLGDYERAYRYMKFSWDESKIFNARLRSWQSIYFLSLIDNSYQSMIEEKNHRLFTNLFIITGLLVLLGIALAFIYRQNKKLSIAGNKLKDVNSQLVLLNQKLSKTNECLQISNLELGLSNHIKEEYIARFIKLCSTYIERLDSYRRMVYKKIISRQIEDLIKITKSQDMINDELKKLYESFDSAFLRLFPDFVNKFNSLLSVPINPKNGELLSTELRIYALIRLGIEESSQIAEFLHYSVNTIYNYRAKIRNLAINKDMFEENVKNIR